MSLALFFLFPCLFIFEEKHTDEEVEEEESTDQNKDNEEERLGRTSQHLRTIISLSNIK